MATVCLKKRMEFFQHLESLTSAGVKLESAVQLAAERAQIDPEPMLVSLSNGQALSESMKSARSTFSLQEIELVGLGEKSGRLDYFLNALAEDINSEIYLGRQLLRKGLYVVLLIHALIFLLLALPNKEFPGPEISTESLAYLAFALLSTFILLGLRQKIAPWLVRSASQFPALSSLMEKLELARFLRNFNALLESGGSQISSWESASAAVQIPELRHELQRLYPGLLNGKPLSSLLESILEREHLEKIRVGEETGMLPFHLADVAKSLREIGLNVLRSYLTRFSVFLNAALLVLLVWVLVYGGPGETKDPAPEDSRPSPSLQAPAKPVPLVREPNMFQVEALDEEQTLIKLGEDLVLFPLRTTMDYESMERASIVAERLNNFYGVDCPICGEYKVVPRDIRVGRYTPEGSNFSELIVFYSHIDKDMVIVPPTTLVTITEAESSSREVTKSSLGSYWRDIARDVLELSHGRPSAHSTFGENLSDKLQRARESIEAEPSLSNLNAVISQLTSQERYRLRNNFQEVPPEYVGTFDEFQEIPHQDGVISPLLK